MARDTAAGRHGGRSEPLRREVAVALGGRRHCVAGAAAPGGKIQAAGVAAAPGGAGLQETLIRASGRSSQRQEPLRRRSGRP